MAKTCFDRFNRIIKITRTICFICGADVLDPNYKMNPLTYTVIFAINCFFGCTIYTIYMGMVVDGDWKVLLQALCLAGSAIQGYSKLILCIYRCSVLSSMNQTLLSIYREYQNDEDYLTILYYRSNLITKMMKIVMWFYIFTIGSIVAYPLVFGLIHGERMFVMQFLLPGIDPTTYRGYVLHTVFQVFLMCLGAFGNFAGDMYIFILFTNIPMLKDIFKIKCEKLNRLAQRTRDPKQTMPVLKEIAQWHQNYNKFVQQVEEVYYGVIFVQVFTSVVSICCTIFSIAIHSWPAACMYLIYSVVLLYSYCGLGNLVEISNDEVIDIIYGDCLWYELSVPEQKLILLMLRKAQKPITLTIGHIMPLSMGTALQLTKAIYSYVMVLLNFLETDDI